jgi:hypothetical protein
LAEGRRNNSEMWVREVEKVEKIAVTHFDQQNSMMSNSL